MAVQTLQKRMNEQWTLDALAEESHLSRSQLVRAFDATVGMSPMAYLRRMRVEQMARLLVSTDLSIADSPLGRLEKPVSRQPVLSRPLRRLPRRIPSSATSTITLTRDLSILMAPHSQGKFASSREV